MLRRLKEQTFDCIDWTCPCQMPGDFSLLETLSNDGSHAFPPVIVYTGHDLS